MKIRPLLPKDAPLMLEWMHDPDVVKFMHADFASKTLTDCERFIQAAKSSAENLHYAVVNDEDEYMGTVSLKHIKNRKAEFAITVRACAMGKDYARFAMESIIRKGFSELRLDKIYWCVLPENTRALRFYDKNGYKRSDPSDCDLRYTAEEIKRMKWYCVRTKPKEKPEFVH